MRHRFAVVWAFLVPLAASRAAADVLVVGPGERFPTIVAAVAAAADGDVVLVKPLGGLSAYGGPVLGAKRLTLLGEPDAGGARPRVFRTHVAGSAAAAPVLLRGLTFVPLPLLFLPPAGLVLEGNARAVVVEDCRFEGGSPAVSVLGSARVLFTRCVVAGSDGLPNTQLPVAVGSGLRAIDSSVALDECIVTGGDGADSTQSLFGEFAHQAGAVAIRVDGGRLVVRGGAVEGGSGGDALPVSGGCLGAGPGAPGLWLATGESDVYLGAGTFVGAGPPGQPLCGATAAAHPPVLVTQGNVWPLVEPLRTLRVSSPARAGGMAAVEVEGLPGEGAFLLLGASPSAQWTPALQGPLLPQFPLVLVPLGPVPPSGRIDASVPIPPLPPGVEALDVHAQIHVAGFLGQGIVGSGSSVTLLAPGF